ncbi:hypothetical protein [Iningainema tapete]|uniref:Uncharacterized protein n=1 Tax=Iningainema tapete BLCC-T55 TaxID=2748662 RepID=A0A8J6XC60_9CYAN|nr:hypothetical protein [Iningainema tapete]MBD2772730.1 hypothetical protein [Iningainema tapete BLCC-T55]
MQAKERRFPLSTIILVNAAIKRLPTVVAYISYASELEKKQGGFAYLHPYFELPQFSPTNSGLQKCSE